MSWYFIIFSIFNHYYSFFCFVSGLLSILFPILFVLILIFYFDFKFFSFLCDFSFYHLFYLGIDIYPFILVILSLIYFYFCLQAHFTFISIFMFFYFINLLYCFLFEKSNLVFHCSISNYRNINVI